MRTHRIIAILCFCAATFAFISISGGRILAICSGIIAMSAGTLTLIKGRHHD